MRWRVMGAIAAVALAAVAAVLATSLAEARADPIVRTARVALRDWPAGAPPVRAVLLSDLHLGNRATDPARLLRIMRQVAALRPDLVLIAGDVLDGHDPARGRRIAPLLVAPLRQLRPRLGVVAVLGNHDHWSDAAAAGAALRQAGVTVLSNAAVTRGPLRIGGVDDDYTGAARIGLTIAALRRLPGAAILLSHSPDIVPATPATIGLILAGHTHCGQIVLPLVGPPLVPSRYGRRYLCGLKREGGKTIVVAAGTGTSNLPLRWNAPPDLWLLTMGPSRPHP